MAGDFYNNHVHGTRADAPPPRHSLQGAPWRVGVAGAREVGSCQLWFKPRRNQFPRTKPSERAQTAKPTHTCFRFLNRDNNARLAVMLLHNAVNRGRRDSHLLGDLANRAAFLVERVDFPVVEHEPRAAADAALLARFRQTGVHTLADADVTTRRVSGSRQSYIADALAIRSHTGDSAVLDVYKYSGEIMATRRRWEPIRQR